MNTYAYNLLLPLQVTGFLWALLLFALCFFVVHAAKLVKAGWRSYKKRPPSPPKTEEKEKKAPATQEPIYYIVERKRRRPKTSYGEPKQIQLK